MNPDLENDLLALIEGRLPSDRVPAVRAALKADPALTRTVEAMKKDREALRAEGARTVRAPESLVAGAMAMAERAALLDDSPEQESLRMKRAATRRFVGAAAALALIPAVAALWIVASNQHKDRHPPSGESRTMALRSPPTLPHVDGAEAPAQPYVDPRETAAELANSARNELDEARSTPVVAIAPRGDGAPVLAREFIESGVPDLIASVTGSTGAGEAGDDDAAFIDHALELALAGRLRIIARCESPDLAMARLASMSAGEGNMHSWRRIESTAPSGTDADLATPAATGTSFTLGTPDSPVSPDGTNPSDTLTGFEVSLTLSPSSEAASRAAVLDMIESLRSRIGPGASIELVELGESVPPRLSTRAPDVLWWGRPVEEWLTHRIAQVQVRVEASESAPGR